MILSAELRFSYSRDEIPIIHIVMNAIELPWVLDDAGKSFQLDWKEVVFEFPDFSRFRFQQNASHDGTGVIFSLRIGLNERQAYINFENQDYEQSSDTDEDMEWVSSSQAFAVGPKLMWEVNVLDDEPK